MPGVASCREEMNKHWEQARGVTDVPGLLLCWEAGGGRDPDGRGEELERRFRVRLEALQRRRRDGRPDRKSVAGCGWHDRLLRTAKASSAGGVVLKYLWA